MYVFVSPEVEKQKQCSVIVTLLNIFVVPRFVITRNTKCYSNSAKNKEYFGFGHGRCNEKYEVLFKFGEEQGRVERSEE